MHVKGTASLQLPPSERPIYLLLCRFDGLVCALLLHRGCQIANEGNVRKFTLKLTTREVKERGGRAHHRPGMRALKNVQEATVIRKRTISSYL